ncbi:hypothetical protein NT6N_08360 [Oceaniferula spumae]|uniref:Uncharacterized protein n=1 Tax=Oceaniferula spumae TaxID=2979115 RepID=A0AAT9FIC1_9BACT
MKNPFTRDDSSIVISTMVGIIILVFVALGLSLVAEGGISLPRFSSSSAKLRTENDALRRRINNLEVRIHSREQKQKLAEANRKQAALVVELKSQLESATTEIGILQNLIKTNNESIELISKGKETHRLRYRDHIRATAPGATFDSITNRLGKEYKDVRIVDVSPLGISISHSTGASRLDFREMPEDWRKKYMFTANEVAAAVAIEQKREARTRQEIARRERETQKIRQNDARRHEIDNLRSQIASLAMKYSSAKLEASLAQNKVTAQANLNRSRAFARSNYGYRSYNSRTGTYQSGYYRPRYRITVNARQSVPGSLETWEGRSVRYQRAATRYASQLASLRSRLASLDPSYQPVPVNN